MILNERTKQELGYYPDDLGEKSHKVICIKCDYCGCEATQAKREILRKRLVVNKDCCKKCRSKKTREVMLATYGVENVFQMEEIKEKSRKTVREKFGVDYHTQSDNFKVKAKQTQIEKYGSDELRRKAIGDRNQANMQEKYGVDNPSQIPGVRDKVKQTNLEKYGHENYLLTDDCKEKTISANLERYGVENVFASEEIKQKIRETNLEKYGVEYVQQNPDVREKVKTTNLEKYGHEYACQNERVKEKIRETNIEKYGVPVATQAECVKQKSRETAIKNGNIIIINGKSMKELAKEIGKAYTTFTSQLRTHGLEVALSNQTSGTDIENIMKNLLDKNNIEYSKNLTINKRKTDFVIPSIQTVIECDGLYWHSDIVLDKQYHHKKRTDYIKAGYKSLFFRQDEIFKKLDIVESIILGRCKKLKNIDSSRCEIVELDSIQASKFFKENHLMGAGKGIAYGLSFKNEILCCVRIKKTENNDYEISKFCNKKGYNIIDGFSRLLKYAEENIKMDKLKFYIDLRYENGKHLEKLGFKFIDSYLSFRWTNSRDTIYKKKFPGNSGYKQGFAKIWDCGQTKYIKEYNVSK